jgi:hypothetical protein
MSMGQTVPAFAQLLELLAFHTKARNINILAYSAGAQVVAPGLASLRDRHPTEPAEELKKQLRIGEVYFAAPDTDFKPFIQRYLAFRNIVERTTINFNKKDKVLQLAAFQNGVSRLGRPDIWELSEEEGQRVIASTNMRTLDVLDLGRSKALNLGGAHNSWYSHPWVSNDLLLLLLFNANPEERGLKEYFYENGAKSYRFPQDYDQKINLILKENRKEFQENIKQYKRYRSDTKYPPKKEDLAQDTNQSGPSFMPDNHCNSAPVKKRYQPGDLQRRPGTTLQQFSCLAKKVTTAYRYSHYF